MVLRQRSPQRQAQLTSRRTAGGASMRRRWPLPHLMSVHRRPKWSSCQSGLRQRRPLQQYRTPSLGQKKSNGISKSQAWCTSECKRRAVTFAVTSMISRTASNARWPSINRPLPKKGVVKHLGAHRPRKSSIKSCLRLLLG